MFVGVEGRCRIASRLMEAPSTAARSSAFPGTVQPKRQRFLANFPQRLLFRSFICLNLSPFMLGRNNFQQRYRFEYIESLSERKSPIYWGHLRKLYIFPSLNIPPDWLPSIEWQHVPKVEKNRVNLISPTTDHPRWRWWPCTKQTPAVELCTWK